ncbi:DUF2238 domain-containing protein [Rhodopirellula halodulae]|uniref:DUF2238 domain-containing protein n=1 Tax=Rhodopirellula halodulae TaxID=2894198 RepID=UPI001E5FAE02|nr:DUF2238 domain-containing protein [Rhodopirellula sp. JC737]MCC9658150.1 DUF2238 domain-containing protein [Rhodopirellula sp. JC737]
MNVRRGLKQLDRQKAVVLATLGCMLLSLYRAPYPNEQWLQHIPTIGMLGGLWWSSSQARLSSIAFTSAIAFVLMHILGARWIYSFVPYDDWSQSLFGGSLSERMAWQRNHYDRLVHFASGLLGVPVAFDVLSEKLRDPIRETRPSFSNGWLWFLSASIVLAVGAAYEVLEWQIAMFFSPAQAEAYNGQQGDMWDAQKDLLLAGLGSLSAIGIHRIWLELKRE